MIATFIPFLFIIFGIINLYFAIRFLKDKAFSVAYMKNSPKAWIWRKLLGEERAIKVTRRIFAPLGICIGIFLVLVGLSLMFS